MGSRLFGVCDLIATNRVSHLDRDVCLFNERLPAVCGEGGRFMSPKCILNGLAALALGCSPAGITSDGVSTDPSASGNHGGAGAGGTGNGTGGGSGADAMSSSGP